ncbi:MFS transporter [Thermoplasma sp. Kam2015]|uniref:MFS transporter n=1 Tax=Thermoplasma sp. Kam2015 TaxID=2094122 RepID=UPI001EFF9BF7|nr:MFS transporter [Thermoplasma sp. Kam2015]
MSRENEGGISFVSMLLIIASITFAVRGSNNMYMTEIPLIARYVFHYGEFLVGAISALTAVGTFIMSALINSRLRSKERRRVFIVSSLIYAVVFPLFYLSNAITIWPIAFFAGFSLGALMPNIITSAGLLPDRKQRERLLSIYTLTLSVSLVVGPALEGYLLKFMPLMKTFLVFSIFPIIVFGMSFFLRFPDERNMQKIETGDVLRNHGFRAAIYNIMTYNIPFAFILTFGGIYAMSRFDVTYSTVTLMFASFFFTSFLSRVLLAVRPPEDIWKLMILSVVITSIGLIGIVESLNILMLEACFLLLGFPHGFTFPLSVISISRSFSTESRNAANSLFFSVMMAVGAVMPFVSGGLVSAIGLKYSFGILVPVIIALLFMLSHEMSCIKKGKSNEGLLPS